MTGSIPSIGARTGSISPSTWRADAATTFDRMIEALGKRNADSDD
jgi:hypothetical protein